MRPVPGDQKTVSTFSLKIAKFVSTTILFIKPQNLYLKANSKFLINYNKADGANVFLKAKIYRSKIFLLCIVGSLFVPLLVLG